MAQNSVHKMITRLIENRNGKPVGIYSVCSSHLSVIRASMEQALSDNSILLIESTSNQVDQFGGYTGMKPQDFVDLVYKEASKIGLPAENLILGGDHLGPNAWQHLHAEEAMKNAKELIKAYVSAGYKKIHLDTSMFCADDEGDRSKPLDDNIVALRAAILCKVAEETYNSLKGDDQPPVYIIGTEVPIPGGSTMSEESITPTSPEDALKTLEITKKAFYDNNLQSAWDRVIGVVVQPGVEFGDDTVFYYNSEAAQDLSNVISRVENVVYEAHSTDYQGESGLTSLVKDHYSILKVGPYLTYSYREALFALEMIEKELLSNSNKELSSLQHTLEKVMLENPKYWKKYYHGNEEELILKRKYSFSDRSRYYWADENIDSSVTRLIKNLKETDIPLSLLSQYMPKQFEAVQNKQINLEVEELISFHIRETLRMYSRACGYGGNY